jgi:hypothetical protein
MAVDVKTIGSSGQISLGKQNAGRTVTLEELEDGVWLIKASRIIPENELWLHRPDASKALAMAIDWAEKHAPKACRLDVLERRIAKRR